MRGDYVPLTLCSQVREQREEVKVEGRETERGWVVREERMEDERQDGTQGKKGIKFLMRWHLAGLGRPSNNFYSYSERGSSLCCCVHEY